MPRVLIPSAGTSSWRQMLADPEKHWLRGASAFETAVSWESAQSTSRGMPAAVAELLDTQPDTTNSAVLIAIPEHKVPLRGPGKASQNDVWALLRSHGGYISMAVEGKAGEVFGELIGDWLKNASSGKLARLEHLCGLLGISSPPDNLLRYQLFHRTASALLEAERFGASSAVMLVQSFRSDAASLSDYVSFGTALGVSAREQALVQVPRRTGPKLYLGWVNCEPATDEVVASVV